MEIIVPKQSKISQEECEEIIQKKYKNNNYYKIINYTLLNLDEKCGFLGEHFRLVIEVSTNTKKSEEIYCFAKFMPETQSQIDFVVTTGAFKKEVYIYEELFPKIGLKIHYLESCTPQYYFSKRDYVIIFEDITKLGYESVSKYKFLNWDCVLVVLKSLAKLHASSLIFEENYSKKLNKKYRINEEHADYFYETFFVDKETHKGGQGVFASIKGLQAEVDIFLIDKLYQTRKEFKEWVEIAGLDLFEKVKPSNKYRNVLCHGDLWNTNFMIKNKDNNPNKCILLDFQTMRYCPPAHDFMSFIHLTTSNKFRKENLQKLQKYYYSELKKLLNDYECNLEELLSFYEFIESCQDQKRFAAVLAATYAQLTQIKNKYIGDFFQDNDRWEEAMYKDRSLMVTVNCERDVEYRIILKETIEELWEIFQDTI